jgi:hypothetical protein
MLSVRPVIATVRISLLRSIAATVAHPTITPLKPLNSDWHHQGGTALSALLGCMKTSARLTVTSTCAI